MKNQQFILIVQGEGRGHLMQALTVYSVLTAAGHEVCCLVVGISSGRSIPGFVKERVKAPVVCLPSLGFAKRQGRKVSLGLTVWHTLAKLPDYISSIRRIHRLVSYHQPDAMVNFYEPLTGLYKLLYPRSVRTVSIAHQYVYLHEGFSIPGLTSWQRMLLRSYTTLTALRSERLLALSITEMPASQNPVIRVTPPILRQEMLTAQISEEGFLLVYLVYHGYMKDVIEWHESNPSVPIHCFTDDPDVRHLYQGMFRYDAHLCFYSIDDRLFREMLASCRAVVTSAGFETVCEALLMGKPFLMVPVEGHHEQQSNALDIARHSLGGWSSQYDLSKAFSLSPVALDFQVAFRQRIQDMHGILLEEITGMSAFAEARVVEMPSFQEPSLRQGNG